MEEYSKIEILKNFLMVRSNEEHRLRLSLG
jgi:hypothetical protein